MMGSTGTTSSTGGPGTGGAPGSYPMRLLLLTVQERQRLRPEPLKWSGRVLVSRQTAFSMAGKDTAITPAGMPAAEHRGNKDRSGNPIPEKMVSNAKDRCRSMAGCGWPQPGGDLAPLAVGRWLSYRSMQVKTKAAHRCRSRHTAAGCDIDRTIYSAIARNRGCAKPLLAVL